MYDPATARFLSKDPLEDAGGSTNLYLYCANDPVNKTDPSGQWALIPNFVEAEKAAWSDLAKRAGVKIGFAGNSWDPYLRLDVSAAQSTEAHNAIVAELRRLGVGGDKDQDLKAVMDALYGSDQGASNKIVRLTSEDGKPLKSVEIEDAWASANLADNTKRLSEAKRLAVAAAQPGAKPGPDQPEYWDRAVEAAKERLIRPTQREVIEGLGQPGGMDRLERALGFTAAAVWEGVAEFAHYGGLVLSPTLEFGVGLISTPIGIGWPMMAHAIDRGVTLAVSPKDKRLMGATASGLDWALKQGEIGLRREDILFIDDHMIGEAPLMAAQSLMLLRTIPASGTIPAFGRTPTTPSRLRHFDFNNPRNVLRLPASETMAAESTSRAPLMLPPSRTAEMEAWLRAERAELATLRRASSVGPNPNFVDPPAPALAPGRVPKPGEPGFVGPDFPPGHTNPLVPGGGLQAHEGVTSAFGQPTHTIHQHIGKDVADLQARLAANRRMSRASTFTDRVEAEARISEGIKQKQAELDAFMRTPFDPANPAANRLPLDVSFGSDAKVGTIVNRRGEVSQGTGIKIIVDKVPNRGGNGFTIVTSYPTP